jgi:nuclear transport factor 2 (NTF2) superfamily protein
MTGHATSCWTSPVIDVHQPAAFKQIVFDGLPIARLKENSMPRPPLPPFTEETAIEKVRLAEDGWNTRDAAKVALAYTLDTKWRNRVEFATNREEVQAFLTRKWNKEHEYRLIKELWAYTGNRIAVRYAYEYRDDSGQWFRAYGNENWEFAQDGLMRTRHASINEMPIAEEDRKFRWPLGRRPDDHPELSHFGF